MSKPVAIVTGGSVGIGRAVAAIFAERGHDVVVADIAPPQDDGFAYVETDVGNAASMEALFAEVGTRFGRLDVLVNNAGIAGNGTVEQLDEAGWDRVMAVNLKSVFLMAKAALPMLRRAPAPAIVNISSVHALTVLPGIGAYAASKAGLDALTRSLAVDLGPDNIRVNSVLPGFIRTHLWDGWLDAKTPEVRTAIESEVLATLALRRVGEPADIARTVAFLASSEAAYITGACLLVDGGLSARSYVLPSNR
jgi:NAD(P)-dependent dehydrogenase (short-subunit alcohol dehydrogenase family)